MSVHYTSMTKTWNIAKGVIEKLEKTTPVLRKEAVPKIFSIVLTKSIKNTEKKLKIDIEYCNQ